ncbi:CSC1-like protein [Seminavis robusta]|uniref:CSC1-like protein n=1 Tax=Seminavis robusta TaxID=568900 RepID=A0A9N8HXU1_9STRA|nr:CSC1-like protein [Seminavis robusta]|eukprot:Sro2309_g322790.1 CSC1-like protein (865) ;mRNA; r:6576-9279
MTWTIYYNATSDVWTTALVNHSSDNDSDVWTNTSSAESSNSTGSGGEQQEEGEPTITTWSGIWVTFLVSALQCLVFYAFFLYQRHQDSKKNSVDLYEPRQHTRKHRSPAPFATSWWKSAWEVEQDELLRCVGLDSFMFLRFLRLGAQLCGLGSVLAVLVLIPVYATGDNRGNATLQFNQITLARVEAASPRLWASLLAWYLFVAFVLYAFWNEWQLFRTHRSAFLARGDQDMPQEYRYAVRVEGIPPEFRTDKALKAYFERLFPNQVQQVTVLLEMTQLQKLIQERQENIEKLEQVVAFLHAKPDKPRPVIKRKDDAEEVDAVEHHEAEIARLNLEIDQERSTFQNNVAEQSPQTTTTKNTGDGTTEAPPHTTELEETAPAKDDDSKATSTAFVTFTSLRAKQAAIQCELTGNPDRMVVFAAPDPKGVLWDNVTVSLTQQVIFQKQAALVFSAGVCFWAIPVAFVTAIANLNGILQGLGLPPADPTAAWYGLISGLLPVIFLSVLMAVLYMAIVAAATHLVRYKSAAEVDAYALYWHQLFQLANLWLILIGGSAFDQIDGMINDPTGIIDIIATAMPGASVFFVNMMLVGSFGAFGLELSMLPTYGVSLVMKLIQPEAMLTQRQLDQAKTPPSIVWGEQVPPVVFVFLVVIVYMPIVPIMEVFGVVYFAGYYLVYKHQCLHVYAQEFEGGGDATWQKLFPFLMACLYMGELIFIAYMGIKEAPVQGAFGFVPLVVTIAFHMHLSRTIVRPLRNLSLEMAAQVDIDDGELDQNTASVLYGMPALKTEGEERGPMPYRRSEVERDEEGGDVVQPIDDEQRDNETVQEKHSAAPEEGSVPIHSNEEGGEVGRAAPRSVTSSTVLTLQ